MDILALSGGGLVASLIIQLVKKYAGKVEGRYGKLITQALLLVACFAVAGIGAGVKLLPPEIINTTIAIFVSGMAIYQIAYKGIYEGAIKGE